ncbi:hypothetical protein M404DRAFT_943171 [Pisolithus tinctorius Marx 270]|uniref:Uncharacterized protein n=1 Tax=Pisolithus tinctorius Marx 270 TaxID=870435 RepID=A0A0C3PFI4_PISTI|nr:hypothetical protein M404DRAFT_943171 [Pisolithus tinctorius Marx 270]
MFLSTMVLSQPVMVASSAWYTTLHSNCSICAALSPELWFECRAVGKELLQWPREQDSDCLHDLRLDIQSCSFDRSSLYQFCHCAELRCSVLKIRGEIVWKQSVIVSSRSGIVFRLVNLS